MNGQGSIKISAIQAKCSWESRSIGLTSGLTHMTRMIPPSRNCRLLQWVWLRLGVCDIRDRSIQPQLISPQSPIFPTLNHDYSLLQWMWSWARWLTSLSSWFVPPAVSLEDCLAAFYTPDRLIGDDMYSCGKCNK